MCVLLRFLGGLMLPPVTTSYSCSCLWFLQPVVKLNLICWCKEDNGSSDFKDDILVHSLKLLTIVPAAAPPVKTAAREGKRGSQPLVKPAAGEAHRWGREERRSLIPSAASLPNPAPRRQWYGAGATTVSEAAPVVGALGDPSIPIMATSGDRWEQPVRARSARWLTTSSVNPRSEVHYHHALHIFAFLLKWIFSVLVSQFTKIRIQRKIDWC